MADPTEADEDQAPTKKDWRKELEDRAKLAEERAERAERKVAFTEAGLTGLTDKQVKALVATHEGDMTSDALKATATELGFVKTESPDSGSQTADEAPDPDADNRAAELAQLANLAKSPANHQAPPSSGEAFAQAVNDFKGDYQQFQEWVLTHHPDG